MIVTCAQIVILSASLTHQYLHPHLYGSFAVLILGSVVTRSIYTNYAYKTLENTCISIFCFII